MVAPRARGPFRYHNAARGEVRAWAATMSNPALKFARPPDAAPARCRSCYYVLENLESDCCPECARPFDPRDPTSFTTKAPFVGWVFWLPALVLSAAGGLLVMAVLVFGMGQ